MGKNVHIIGAGPAGCATALALRQESLSLCGEIDITIIDKPSHGAAAIGETIPPAACERLRKLGLAHVLNEAHLECPGSIAQWGEDQPGYNDFLFTPVGRGYHLNRDYFNRQLQAQCEQQDITFIHDSRVTNLSAATTGAGYELTLNTPSRSTITTDFVVDATGTSANIARAIGVARNEYDSVVSLCAFYSLAHIQQMKPARTIVSATQNGWWYATRLPQNQVLISFCTDAITLKEKQLHQPFNWYREFERAHWLYPACEEQFGVTFSTPTQLHKRAAPSAILSNCVGSDWAAVGDAAASFDSMTSAGITKALSHGIAAGRAIARRLLIDIDTNDLQALKDYQQEVFAEFSRYLQLHQQLYGAEKRFPNSGFWQRRLLA